MNKILTIAKRELRSYFDTPIAYVVMVVFLLGAGAIYFSTVFLQERADMRDFFYPYSPIFFTPAMLFVFLAPAITMRLVAEEKKAGTIELISTMPLTNADIILGKFLAALGLSTIALLSTLVYAISITAIGDMDWGPVFSGYLGMILFSAALLAIGLMCSTWTDNQIISFIIALVICGVLYFVYELQFFLPATVGSVAEFISVSSHLKNLARGIVDSRDVIYYLTLMAGALFVAERSLARQRA